MKQYSLPRGATGIDHHSGRSFRARPNGRVDLPDNVAKDFEKNGALRHYDVIAATGAPVGLGRKDDRMCTTCGFTPWEWQDDCPRCGTKIPKETKK
jgi:hypothetical protein